MPAPEPGQRWGILGGAFDPVHLGHFSLARDVRKQRALDGIMLVPTYDPPHRPGRPVASFADRLEMLQLALGTETGWDISPIEEKIPRPSYTLNMVRALKTVLADVELELIVGADQFAQLQTWHRWKELLTEVKLIVGCRPGTALDEIENPLPGRIIILETALLDLSSTHIRARIRDGIAPVELAALVPRTVAEYIVARELYR